MKLCTNSHQDATSQTPSRRHFFPMHTKHRSFPPLLTPPAFSPLRLTKRPSTPSLPSFPNNALSHPSTHHVLFSRRQSTWQKSCSAVRRGRPERR
ncbi:hypothetical protein DM02DRAFT_326595 [Periconia macrospinosa]|uniref:Uncharacterized protein n=1 Tax=Periconia macrospinosa TaxID=97972 RepID=A0A2V1EDS7_9PLEO|nr:hypothetical protein DM02DRAFT_326595 [Periconia macrospinosa]